MTERDRVDRPKRPHRTSSLPRGALSQSVLVDRSLELLDRDGVAGFSLPKLGRYVGCDQTAVYRHFGNKDELLLAVADRLIEQAYAGFDPAGCWVDVLLELAHRVRRTYLLHHAAASLSGYRTTGGPAEMRAADSVIGSVLQAGFTGAEAAHHYRCFVDFVLYWCGGEASSLSEQVSVRDRQKWSGAYLVADPDGYRNIRAVREFLPGVAEEALFGSVLDHVVAGIAQHAPAPCDCLEHAHFRASTAIAAPI